MKRKAFAPAVVCITIVMGLWHHATAQSDFEIFEAEWAQAKEYEPETSFYMRWTETLYPDPTLSKADLEAMASRIEGRPDHPERQILETERRRRREGPDVNTNRVWYDGPGLLRYSRTNSWRDLYLDVALTPKAHWSLIPSQLTVMSAKNPTPKRDLTTSAREFQRMLRQFVWAGYGSGLVPISAEETSNSWLGRAGKPEFSTLEWKGAYSQEAGRVLPSSEVILDASERFTHNIGNTTTFEGWSFLPELGSWAASRIEERNRDGKLLRVWEIAEVRPLKPKEFASVSAIPSLAEEDPIRGVLTFKTIMDFRPGIEKTTTFHDTGVTEYPISADQLGRAPSAWLRGIGWTVAGLIVTALVALRLIRARSVS